jgi:hypothetical protein
MDNTKHMSTGTHTLTLEAPNRILSLLADLPPDSLALVERFVEFLHEQAQQGQPVGIVSGQAEQPPYRYPTVSVPPSSLDRWLNLAPEGYEGDALADTEALYDETL